MGRRVIPIEATAEEVALHEVRGEVHARAVHGRFAKWRWTMAFATQIVFYGLPWLTWNGRQAVLFDLGARKFYIFGCVFWPQDFIYLDGAADRRGARRCSSSRRSPGACGAATPARRPSTPRSSCWIERKIEGDRLARMRLDAAPMSLDKLVVKALKHAAWLAVALWTGYTFVGYFTPIRDSRRRARSPGSSARGKGSGCSSTALATYGNAGWMREQVCKYMCPYARFQSVMFDRDTLVITYDARARRAARLASQAVDARTQRTRRLRRLRHLRAGLPDRHRHPQGAAVRMHRLRRVHRRLRPA